MDRPLRVGMIGTSFICEWMCDAARRTDVCVMHAVFSRDEARGKAFAEKEGIPLAFSDFQTFLNCPEIDAVYVASPNAAHYRQTMAALSQGKHVLCEKPVAVNARQAERMIECAHEKKLVMIEAIRPVYEPFLMTLKDSLPLVGRVRRATFEFSQYSSRYDRFKAGEQINAFDASLGNASLLDLGVYCLHCAVALFGMPVSVHAGATFLPNGTEAAGTVLLDYGDQQTTICYSKVSEAAFPSQIQGEEGTLAFDKPNQPTYFSRRKTTWYTNWKRFIAWCVSANRSRRTTSRRCGSCSCLMQPADKRGSYSERVKRWSETASETHPNSDLRRQGNPKPIGKTLHRRTCRMSFQKKSLARNPPPGWGGFLRAVQHGS